MNYDTAYDAPRGEALAVGLGWFSIALGVAELAAPHSVAQVIGVAPTDRTIAMLRSYGAREIGTGLAILAQPDRPAWLWSRVAGDALDLATLASVSDDGSNDRGRMAMAAAAVLGVAALDVLCARRLASSQDESDGSYSDRLPAGEKRHASKHAPVRLTEAVTINAPIEQVEEHWSRTDSLPESLRTLGCGSEGTDQRAIVEFRVAPAGRGTEVRIELEYMPKSMLGRALAKIVGGDPTGQLRHDLRQFKQIVETGEIVLSDGPALWRPGRPAEDVQEIRKAAGLGV